jgi:hypothetical protein
MPVLKQDMNTKIVSFFHLHQYKKFHNYSVFNENIFYTLCPFGVDIFKGQFRETVVQICYDVTTKISWSDLDSREFWKLLKCKTMKDVN